MLLLKSWNRRIRRIISSLVCALLAAVAVHAESGNWKNDSLDKGKIAIRHRIAEEGDAAGASAPIIEYVISAVDDLDMNACIALMKDAARHREWVDAKSSELVATISDHEWLLYYRFAGMGPIPGTDCVVRMSFSGDAEGKKATFSLNAAPDLYEMKDVKRMAVYDVSYDFKNIGNGKVEVTSRARISPAVKVPLWMIKAGYPGSAVDQLRKILKAAK
jgi:hypothetical protein